MDSMQRVTSFIGMLEGMRVVVAGGCARDLSLGDVPKDYDLWVVEDINVADGLAIVQEAVLGHRTLHDELVSIPEVHGDDYGNGPDKDSDIEWVIKAVIGDTEIDVIKLFRDAGEEVSPYQIVQTFDFPLNQFWVSREGIIGTGHFHYEQKALRPLVPERVQYMQDKFPIFNFIQ